MLADSVVVTAGSQADAEGIETHHFSPALKVDGKLYVSGVIGVDDQLRAIPDPELQFIAVFEHIAKLLNEGGANFGDVFELMSFHTSFELMDLFLEVKDRYILGPTYPTWTAVGTPWLVIPGAFAEMKCTALLDSTGRGV